MKNTIKQETFSLEGESVNDGLATAEESAIEVTLQLESQQPSVAHAAMSLVAQAYWDKGYDAYQFSRTPDTDPIRLWLTEHLPKSSGSCLEIGAFPGRYLSIFGEMGYELHGIDLHDGITDRLPSWFHSRGFNVGEFHKADFLKATFNRQFEVVSSFGFIEHFDRWDVVVQKKFDLVKPGGIFVVETPNFAGALQKYLHCALDSENVKRHNLASMNPDAWAQLAMENGFEIITSGYFGGFDFWVDNEPRTVQQHALLGHLYALLPFLRQIDTNDKAYSPYCGLIARKKNTAAVRQEQRRATEEKSTVNINAKVSRTSQALKILNTVEFYAPHVGGAEAVVQQLSERLVQRGHCVTVATTKLAERNFKELNGVQIKEFDVNGNLIRGIQGADVNAYRAFVSSESHDVMFNYAAQQWATDLAFHSLAAMRQKRGNVLAPCGYSALKDSKTLQWEQYAPYFNDVLPKVLPLYDALVHHSARYKDYQYAKHLGLPNCLVIPNGADEDEFERPRAVNFREKYGITTKHLGLCVANYYDGKGHDRLIEVIRQLRRPDFELILIGKEGDRLEGLQQMAQGLPVRFLVNIPREDTLAAFRAADVFLFGSQVEAFPLVILEAKASGVPFVSTDCGNVRELRGGIVCDIGEFPSTLNKMLDQESYRTSLGAEGKREWREQFTWNAIVDQYERLFAALAESKKGRH